MDTTGDREEIQREEIPFSQDDKDGDNDAGDEYSYFGTTMQLSSSEHTAEHLRRTQQVGGTTEDVELENIQGNEDMNQRIEVLEEKPWRRAGADITDYFNYGFDEKSWNAYCRKQKEVRRVKMKLKAKIKKRQTGYGGEGTSSSGRASIPAFRESDPTDDSIGGQPESSRQERHQSLNDGGSNAEVDNSHQLPPPGNMNFLFEISPPTSLFFHLGPRPPSPPTTTLVSGNSKGFGCPATSLSPRSSRRITVTPGVIDATKAWECCILREKHNNDGDRCRGDGHDKISKRRRYGEENSSSRCSKEEQMKCRDVGKRGHQHRRFGRGSREKGQRDKDEGSRGTSGSSRRSREVAGNRENRRKHRKSTRSRKEEKSRMFSADQERKLKFH